MAKKRSRKVNNRSKSTNRNSRFFAVSEVNVNPVNRTFLPNDTVARISTDDWWEDISIPGYTSKRNLLRKLQEDDLYDDTRIVTSPFTNWWSHVGSRNLPDHLPREHKISVSPTLPDVPATPEIQHVGRRIAQERFDNMWDEKTDDLSSNPRTIKNARGSVLQKPKPNLESCATENILERGQHHSDSGNLSEHSLLYTSKDFTNRIRKQKGSKSIRRRKENYQKLALLNNIKKIELPDQNGSYESNKGHGSESESVKTSKIQLSKLMSCENNSISYPNVTDTYNNSLPERAQKTGRFYDAFKDDTVSITNEDLHLSQNSNKMLSDLSGVTDIKGRLSLSSSNTKDMKRARKQRKLLHVSWSGQIDPNNSNVQHRRNITSLLDMTNPSIKNEFESKEPPKNGLKYLRGFLDVSNEDKLSEVNYKQTGMENESRFLSKLNLKPVSTQREQFLNIEDLNEIPSEKLLTQLSHSEHKVLTKMSSLADGSDSELPHPRSTSFRFSSSPQSTRDSSVGNVPTIPKVKSKFLQNLTHDTSICDSLSAESTTGTGKKLILSRASRNSKRVLISDKLLALSDVGEDSKEKENETLLEEVETTLKNSRRDSSATGNVHADMKTKFTKSLAMTDLLTKQSAALHLQEENKSFLDTSQSCGSKKLNKVQHSKNYDTETELPNLQLGTSVLREVTENSKGSSTLENRREAKHGVLESNNSRRDLSASEKERVQKTKGSRLHNITDSQSKLQQSLQDLSRHDISKEISSNLQHDPEITHEDVSKSEPNVNNQSRVFSETDKEKQVHFESNEHSDQEASKSLMGDKQVPKCRSQRLSSQHSKNDNDASKLLTDQLSHQSDEENVYDSGVSATRKKAEHGVQVPKNSRRDLSASEIVNAQEKSKDLKLNFVTDSSSKQSTKQQLHHRDLSKHSMAKEVSLNVQHEREITLEDVSRSEREVNNQSRVFSDTDKEKQVHFDSNVHSDREASKSLMGDKQVPKRRSQRLSSQHSKNDNDASKLFTDQLSHQSDEENANDSGVSATRKKAEHGVQVPKNSRRDLSASEIVNAQEKSKDLKLNFVTDSPSKQSTKQQLHHRDLSKHSMAKEVSLNVQHEREITLEDVSRSEREVNNQSRVFSDTDKEKQVHFDSNVHSDREASKSLMGDKQVPKRRSQRLSSQHSKNDNDASKLFTDQLSHQSDEENANDSGVSATRKKAEHGVQVPKNSRRDLSASEIVNAQEKSKDLKLNFVTDSPSKQSTKQQLHHRDLSKHSMAKEVSLNVQHEREIALEDVSRSEREVNNQSRVFSDTDKEKQVHFESNVHSDREASKSLMGDKQVPKRRSQRLSSQHSKNDNDASKLFTDQLSHQSDEENANDSGVSATRKKAERGVQVPKNSRRDLSASEILSAQEKSKDLRLHFVTDSPRKQSTKQQPSHQGLSQDSTSKEISSNMQHLREITHEDVSKSESEVNNQCSEFLEKNEQKHVHFEVNTLSRQEESMSFLEADQAFKCRSLRISSQQSKNVDNDVSNLVSEISLLQGVGENSNESRINVSEKKGGQRVMIQKNSGKGLSASENMNVEEARKHSVSNVISSTDRSTLQRTLQDLVKSFTTERVSANANNEREITHEGSVSKLTNRSRVCLESCEKEQSSVRSNIYSGNKDESTSLVTIAQTSKDEVRLKSLDSMNVFISPVIAQGIKRRIMKQGIADHSKSVSASSITQPGMKLVPSEKHDSRGKMNSHLTINTSQSSRDVVKSPENISNNKSQPQRLRSNMESVFRMHTSTSNKDKYQKETNNESVKDTKFPSARIRTKSSTSQNSFPQSKVIALDSKSESMKNNSNTIDTVISKSKFMGNKFNTLFLEESRPKEDERDILSTTIVENNLDIMSQKLSAVRSHLKRQHEKLALLQYRKACKQIQTHPANYAKFKKLLAHREKMEDIFNVNDRHSSKNNHVLNIRSQKKDIAEKKSNRETERVASILQYVKSTKSPLRISWGNAVGHPKLAAAVSKTKTSVNRKLETSDHDVIIIRDVNKAPRIKRPTWLHTRLYKSLSKTVLMKIKDKNLINPQKESQEIISKLGSLIDKALRYRRKGCNPFVDEVIKHLYHSAIIKTPMNFICFCMRYLPETFIDIALRVKENDSGILGNVIDRDLNL